MTAIIIVYLTICNSSLIVRVTLQGEKADTHDSDDSLDGHATADTPALGVTPAVLYGRSISALLVGLAYGEARALHLTGRTMDGPRLRCGVATQLAAFTADALIRARGRIDTEGQADLAPMLWTGLVRWAGAQGVAPRITGIYRDLTGSSFPDGWLARVPGMRERRGSAPATVKALSGGIAGTPDAPVVTSHGSHGLVRSLPIAGLAALHAPHDVARLAFESCALTHGDPFAMHATVGTVICLAHVLRAGTDVDEALRVAIQLLDGNAPPVVTDRFRAVADARARNPRSLPQLLSLAADRSALSVAAAALYSFGEDVDEDIEFVCRSAGDQPAASAVVAAFHGVTHGTESLDPATVARLEAAWPMEVLGRDLAVALTEYPAGDGETRLPMPGWPERYPAW